MMRLRLLPLFLLLAANFVPPHKELARPQPLFVAKDFFVGRTESSGTILGPLSRRTALRTESVGRLESDDTLVLDQIVHRQGHPPARRQWRIRKLANGTFRGSITDAKGAVVGEVKGNCLRLRYTLAEGGLATDQYMYLQPGGRAVLNRMTLRKLGFPVARVEETIRRVG